jgi:hypothetical protein
MATSTVWEGAAGAVAATLTISTWLLRTLERV